MKILGINISDSSKKEVLEKIEQFLNSEKQNIIVTPNPEIILQAQDDEQLFHILNVADLSLADGVGIKLLGFLLGQNAVRITGADILIDILQIAQRQKLKIGVINWSNGMSNNDEIKKMLEEKFAGIKTEFVEVYRNNFDFTNCDFSNLADCEIIFATLGAPFQEKTIFNNLSQFRKARILIGIGGGMDFLTGKITRAPRLFRQLGLEWLWRLIKQPVRMGRIINAVVVFPLMFFKFHFINIFFYRPNVACLIYKKTEHGFSFLLINRTDSNEHWQLPQGGLDGLNAESGAKKEIREELGIVQIETRAIFKSVYFYKYIDKKTVVKHRGYKGQKQDLYIAEFLGRDSDIKIKPWEHAGWKWVSEDDFISTLNEVRRESGRKFLDNFRKIDKKV